MGFRDLENFNSTLLAKLLWRVHLHPNTLLARTLKCRYFLNSNIWDTKLGYKPSYAWRSIWGSRVVLERATRWRIGNRLLVAILKDAWLGGGGTGKIATPCSFLSPDAKVHELFDQDTMSWNKKMVSSLFLPVDTAPILSVPISKNSVIDEHVWYGNNEGAFKVKEAYRIAMARIDSASCSSGPDPMWKKMWHLNIPSKAKIFLWRAIWDIIPHNKNLQRKGVLDLGRCPRCGANESATHVFKECSWARQFRSVAPNMIYNRDAPDIRTWISDFLHNNNLHNAELLTVFLWQILYARNELCFEKIYTSPEICVKRATDGLLDYQRWNVLTAKRASRTKEKWARPDSG